MRKIIVIMVLAVVLANASHLSDLMARYKRAPESQRYKIMNQIKREIARLNKKRQNAAIRELRAVNNAVQSKKSKRRHTRTKRTHRRSKPMTVLEGRGASGGGTSAASAVSGSVSGVAESAQDAIGGMQEQAGEMMGGISGGFQ